MMQERQALLGIRENIHGADGVENAQQRIYETMETYDTCEEVDCEHTTSPTLKERKSNGGWNLRLARLSGIFGFVLLLGVSRRGKEKSVTATSKGTLRSHTGTEFSPESDQMKDSLASLPRDLADSILEKWEEWKVPIDDIHSGRVWKESIQSLYHVWEDTTLERQSENGGNRRLHKLILDSASPRSTPSPSPITPQSTVAPPTSPPRVYAQITPDTTSETADLASIAPVPSPTPKGHPTKRTHAPQVQPHDGETLTPSPDSTGGHVERGGETAEPWAKHTWKKLEDGAESAWHKVENGTESVWEKAENGVENAWEEVEDQEHKIATNIYGNQTSTNGSNTTFAQAEKEWYHKFVNRLRHLGKHMRSWWVHAENVTEHESREVGAWINDTEHALAKDERVVQHKFKSWWKNASTAEKIWWRDTSRAFKKYTQEVEEKEKLWWMITRDTSEKDWAAVLREEEHLWNETVNWEHTFVNESRTFGQRSWASVSNTSVHAWVQTVDEEDRIWHAIRHWYKAHATYQEELKMPLVYFNSTPAFSQLVNNYGWFDSSQDFFHFQSGWDTQVNQAYCAVATTAAVLNSMPRDAISLSLDPTFSPYPYATQNDLFKSICVQKTVVHHNNTYDGLFNVPGGLNLEQTHNLMRCHLDVNYFDIQMVHVNPRQYTLDDVRKQLRMALVDPMARVVINYDRRALGQIGVGHFSPVGGYTEREDSFLIMDVAKYKYPPVWVPAARLYASMATVDMCGNWDFPRGQDRLSPEEEKTAFTNKTLYEKLLKRINCQKAFRGYIVVRMRQ